MQKVSLSVVLAAEASHWNRETFPKAWHGASEVRNETLRLSQSSNTIFS